MVQRSFIVIITYFLSISDNLSAQDVNDFSLYKMDSVYKAIQGRIDSDTSADEWRSTLITLNKGVYLPGGKEDTAYKYIKLAYDSWPHDACYANFNSDSTANYINLMYPKILPKSYKYMIHIKDSIEKTYNKTLQEKMLQLYIEDQKDRIEYDKLLSRKNLPDITLRNASDKIDRNDLSRISQIDSIIKIYGYPGKKLVSLKYSHFALIIIQHSQSEKLINYFIVLEEAIRKGDLSKGNFPYFIDRFLIGTERKQLFGTQFKIVNGELLFFPIGNPEHLNVRRNNFGLIKFEDELKYLKDDLRKSERK